MGRVDDTSGKQHFAFRLHDVALAILQILNSDGSPAIKYDAGNQSVDQHVEVGAPERWPEIRGRGAAPPSVSNGHLQPATAFRVGTVIVLGHRIAGRLAG